MSLTPPQLPLLLQRRKQERQAITVLTAWDAISASWAEAAGVDLVLVGDSLAMVSLGHSTTLPVSLEAMLHHAAAVERAWPTRPWFVTCPFSVINAALTRPWPPPAGSSRKPHALA